MRYPTLTIMIHLNHVGLAGSDSEAGGGGAVEAVEVETKGSSDPVAEGRVLKPEDWDEYEL